MAVHRAVAGVAAVGLLIGHASLALGQANCSLRNPDRQIYEIFPDATSYRTVEANVNALNRETLEKEIGSSLAPTDMGTHSAYVVLNGKVPIGFVHARSEIGSRGSIELVWAMDIDLTITDFRVQRSRERQTKDIKSEMFRSKIVGRNLADLRDLLSSGNDQVNLSSLEIPASSASIARTAVLCALKTRVITEHVFRASVAPARLLAHVHREFSDVGSVKKVATPLSQEILESIRETLDRDVDQARLSTLDVYRILGAGGGDVGVVVRADWEAHLETPECWWAIRADGTVQRATIAGRRYAGVQRDFEGFEGQRLEDFESEASDSGPSSRRLAREILAIVSGTAVAG